MNRGTIYISERSPISVVEAYVKQFRRDFWEFLRKRAEEVVSGGRMVLILLGRDGTDHVDRGNSFMWHLLAEAFAILVSKVTKLNAQIFILFFKWASEIISKIAKFHEL